MREAHATSRFSITGPRRLLQVLVLAGLILTPMVSSNPVDWAPSRIILGHIPQPATLPIHGDTWTLGLGSLQFSHPLAFADTWLSAKVIYLPLLLATALPLALTLLLGRVFCSWLCPVGFLLEMIMGLRTSLATLPLLRERQLPDLSFILLGVALGFSFLFALPFLSLLDPPHTLGRELMYGFTHGQVSLTGIGLLSGLLLADLLLQRRACCARLCPSGAGLALLGKPRLLRLELDREQCIDCSGCNTACPYDLAPMEKMDGANFDWTRCDNCGRCRDACPSNAISYTLTCGKMR